jgi:hypothetical protein
MITYIQTAHRDTTCFIWYTKIYLISIHDILHSKSTETQHVLSYILIKYILVYHIKHAVSLCAV